MDALVTGGAGFIGSHLVDALRTRGDRVRVLDDLSMGLAENVPDDVELIEGSVADEDVVTNAVAGAEVVFHQAAIGSVQRSIDNPGATDLANVHGTLTVLHAAAGAGARRVVMASSSSIYGGTAPLPTREDAPADPKSPYAVSKYAGELYGRVFANLIGLETVCLRYFNVYGRRQRADSPYAAVIPRFVEALRAGTRPVVYGDGRQTRDFTFVGDAVAANLAAGAAPREACNGRVFNVAGGRPYSLLDLLDALGTILGVDPTPEHADPRPGDVRDSAADLTAARRDLGWEPQVGLEDGLRRTLGLPA